MCDDGRMLSLSLGPVALPVRPLLLMLSLLLAIGFADRLARKAAAPSAPPGRILVQAVVAGLAAARGLHVALHAGPYLDQPLSIVDLRDGGWQWPAGLVAALAWAGGHAWRVRTVRRPLAAGIAAGLTLWGVGSAALWLSEPVHLPALAFTDLDGRRTATLAERAGGKPLVVNLWATWCGPCRREMPALAQAQAAHPEVVFVFVNQGEQAETVRRWLQAEQPRLAGVVLDEGARLGRAVGSVGLPTTVFYDADGVRTGALNTAAIEARLAQAARR